MEADILISNSDFILLPFAIITMGLIHVFRGSYVKKLYVEVMVHAILNTHLFSIQPILLSCVPTVCRIFQRLKSQ
jgi:hypothetical protein